MLGLTHFEQIPLKELTHLIEEQAVFSVLLAWAENQRFYYAVTVIGRPGRTFTVCLDGVQEAKWGTRMPTDGRELIGTCSKPIQTWCRMNLDQLPANGETAQIFLDGVPRGEAN